MQVTNTTTLATAAFPMNASATRAAAPVGRSAFRDIYSQAVGSSAAAVPDTPSYYNDKTLASFIAGKFTGSNQYPIDTTKTINWQSSGDHTLTAEEIARLKEKYDVTNLTAQQYYDLMSDLTHMEVLSGSDVMGVHLATAGSEVGFNTMGSIQGEYQGNAVNYFAVMLTRLLESWEWINSDEYKTTNSYLSAEKQALIREATLKDLQPRQKMADVLTQLQ